jgi:hypothetical protein
LAVSGESIAGDQFEHQIFSNGFTPANHLPAGLGEFRR